jgi:hypothetical protein
MKELLDVLAITFHSLISGVHAALHNARDMRVCGPIVKDFFAPQQKKSAERSGRRLFGRLLAAREAARHPLYPA